MSSSPIDTVSLAQFPPLPATFGATGVIYCEVAGVEYQITLAQLVTALFNSGVQPLLLTAPPTAQQGQIGQVAIDVTNGVAYPALTSAGWTTGVNLCAGALNAAALAQLSPIIASAIQTALAPFITNNASTTAVPTKLALTDAVFGTLDGSFGIGAQASLSPSLYIELARAQDLPSVAQFSRTDSQLVLNKNNFLSSVLPSNPKWLFNEKGKPQGLLIEPASSNLCIYSRPQLGTNGWSPYALTATLSSTELSMDGVTYANLYTETTGNSTHQLGSPAMPAALVAGPFCATIHLKTHGRDVIWVEYNGTNMPYYGSILVNIALGTVLGVYGYASGGKVTLLENGWARVEYYSQVIVTPGTATGGYMYVGGGVNNGGGYQGDGVSGFYADYWQYEQLYSPTQVVVSGSAPAVKAADKLVIPTSAWSSSNQGSFVIDGTLPSRILTGVPAVELFRLWDTTTANSIIVSVLATGQIQIVLQTAGTVTATLVAATVLVASANFKIGFSYGAAGVSGFAVNGSTVLASGTLSAAVAPPVTQAALGYANQSVAYARMQFYREVLTSAQLQYFTTS